MDIFKTSEKTYRVEIYNAGGASNTDQTEQYNSPQQLLEKVVNLKQARQYSEAFAILISPEMETNPEGQRELGEMYMYGYGVEKNYEKALHHLRCALDGKEGKAWTDVGVLFKNGWGVKRDYQEAIKCFRNGLKEGDPRAHRLIGDLYKNGLGVEQDEKQAIYCYRKAIEEGDNTAYTRLGWVYYARTGGPQDDHKKAMQNFQLAVKYGDVNGHTGIGCLYHFGAGVDRDYKKAMEHFEKVVGIDEPVALYGMGRLYYWGQGVAEDFSKAMECFKKAEAAGHQSLYTILGEVHYQKITSNSDNDVTSRNHAAIALYWYRQSERLGDAVLGKINDLQNKHPSLKNTDGEKRFSDWWVLAKTDDAEGRYQFGLLYKEGTYLAQSDDMAQQSFKVAADKDHVLACLALGDCYHNDFLGQHHYFAKREPLDLAKQYYKKAADLGNAEGCYKYAMLSEGEEKVKYLELASEKDHEKAALELVLYRQNKPQPSGISEEEVNKKLAEYMLEQGVDGNLTDAGSQIKTRLQKDANNTNNNTNSSLVDDFFSMISKLTDKEDAEKNEGNAERMLEKL